MEDPFKVHFGEHSFLVHEIGLEIDVATQKIKVDKRQLYLRLKGVVD